MSRRVLLPLLVNIGALGLVAAAAVYVIQATSVDPADNDPVVSNPDDVPASGANTAANQPTGTGNGNAGGPDSGNSDADALPPLLPALSADEYSTVTRCAYFLYHEDQAEEMVQRLTTEFDCRAIVPLRTVNYRSQEHLALIEYVARVLADRPYRDGEGGLYFPGLMVQPDLRRIVVEAEALQPDDGLEFLVCSPRGKSHESLFQLTPSAKHLALALHLIKCRPCTGVDRPMVDGDWALWPGDTVRMQAKWMLGRTKIERPIEDLVLTADGAKLPDTGWVFTGSPTANPGDPPMADTVGPVVSLWSSPFAILTNPWPDARTDSAYKPSDLHPDAGTRVHLTLLPETDAVRHARLDSLQDVWDAFADHREEMLTEAGARALSDAVTVTDAERLIAQPDPDADPDGEGEPDDMERFAFPALVPELTEAEVKRFHTLVGALAGNEAERVAAFEALCDLDARHESLADTTWRGLRADPARADLLATAMDKMAYQPYEDDNVIYWRGIAVDKQRKLVVADAVIAPFENMPLEFLICGPRGKGHESIFLLSPHARNLEAGLEALGFRASKQQPTHQGDWRLYDGDTVIIEAAWLTEDIAERPQALAGPAAYRDQPGIICKRVEQLVIDRETNQPLPPTGFAFTGSYIIGQGDRTAFAADEAGAIVGALTVPQSVLENPWPRAGMEHAYVAARQHIPKTHRPVRLFFYLEPEEERLKRQPALEAAWESEKTKRPEMSFDRPDGWKKIGARTDFVFESPERASLAVMVEGKYTAEETISPGYREFVFDKTEFDPDFKSFIGPYTPHGANLQGVSDEPWRTIARKWNEQGILATHGSTPHGGHPMWRFIWLDQENQPVFRAVIMTSRFYYHVFAFWPGRKDINVLEGKFLELLDRLEIGHPENQITVGEGWVKKKTLPPKHDEMLGDWTIDVTASIRNNPANIDKTPDELAAMIQQAQSERLHEAVVGIAEDRIDIFQPNMPQWSQTYSITKIDGDTLHMDLIQTRTGHLRETTLTVSGGRIEGDFAGRYLVLKKGE